MDAQVQVAIAGAIAVVIAPLITLLVKSYLEQKKYIRLSGSRQASINGKWVGTTEQQEGPEDVPILVELSGHLRTKGRTVVGEAEVRWKGVNEHVKVIGGFYDDNHIRLDYESVDSARVNFGTLILRLSANSKVLSGKMIGYGSESEMLIFGETRLNKEV